MITNYLFRHRQKVAMFFALLFYIDLFSVGVIYGSSRVGGTTYYARRYDAGSDKKIRTFFGDGIKNTRLKDSKNHPDQLIASKNHIYQKSNQNKRTDIGGPGQPEMQAFQSANTNNMVDLFSGDFSYNIPLMDVGGYPVGLAYRGGVSMDQESSWVGLGWNINPGTISRNVRGLPDDFNGTDSITKELNTRKKWTAGVNVGFAPEIFGLDLKFLKPTLGIYYDNYTGPGFNASINPSLNGGASAKGDKTYGIGEVTLGVSFDSKSGFNINPTFSASLKNSEDHLVHGEGSIGLNYNSRMGLQNLQMNGGVRSYKTAERNSLEGASENSSIPIFSSTISFSSPTFTPGIQMPTTYAGFTFSASLGGEIFGFHPLTSISGFYNQNYIAPKDRVQKMPAYGYLNMTNSQTDPKALLDFNREKDIPYRNNVPNIAVPFQTYDVFSITGEGIGGSFRAYRGDAGIVHDHEVKSKSNSANVGIDFGSGDLVIAGADVRFTYAYSETKTWQQNNAIKNNLVFKNSDSTYEAVYFRNPGEQTSNTAAYYSSIGDDDVMRVKLTGNDYDPVASNYVSRFNKLKQTGTLQLTTPPLKMSRDKRSQVISYLSATEASQVGLEREIHSYPVNVFPKGSCDTSYESILRADGVIRKGHHISEITVLNPDGRRYVYGIPAYNLVQTEATFAVNKSNAVTSKGLVSYSGTDLSSDNNNGKDGYFNMQTTPAHAHSFLLTALMSPDYVDVTGNGISDDDIGDAVKFNYTRMKWSGDYSFKWRTPTDEDKANYDEGMRTDNSDDKGHIVYGEKEIWYLNSIESKTMIATFKLDTDSLRKDGFEVKDINGGRSTSTTKKLMRLKEINLYSKADLKKYGTKARPIKTVHFAYSYRLCKGYPDLADTATGKLTLESVWFTYNGNPKGKENSYVFNYGNNPNYQYKAYDRWGNYKPSSDNPSGIPSDEYPYALKDSTTAAHNAAAWALTDIIMPSGGKMKIDYESDDYAYVQNRRAKEMFQITGFGFTKDDAINNNSLYQGLSDRRFVFVDVPVAVNDKKDISEKYFQDSAKLYLKLYVRMPGDTYGTGFEYIPLYADVKDYGKVSSNRIWIELQPSPEGNSKSPLATAALQFLRLNLPSKAYPGSDVKNDPAFKAAILSVLSIAPEAEKLLLGGFGNDSRIRNRCKEVQLSNSFVRLSSPAFKRYGGGYRVKRITISDNWQKMTGRTESVYGQQYDYTTTKVINGKNQLISSGVASYEPSIGNEENPFHQPVEYTEKATLAPSNFMYVEEPFAESLFPSASVGYSKVRVSSINRKNIKSAPGFEETEFYTAYDFPTLTERTQFDKDSYKKGIDKINLFNIRSRKYITLSQGFKIELNDMHGKMKSSAVYAENDSIHPITYTAQYYRCEKINGESYRLINTVPVIDSANGKINQQGQIGKDIELVTDMREQVSSVKGAGAKFNLDGFILPIPVFPLYIAVPSLLPEFSMENSRYRSVAMLKVIQRYGIIDSVVHIDKGSKISIRNIVWDGETGEVLLTTAQNEYNDPVYQFTYPAHWAYQGVGPAYKNIDAILHKVRISGGKMAQINGGSVPLDIVNRVFESGDEVLVLNKASFITGAVVPAPVKIEAEDYVAMSGVSTFTTTDVGGGLGVGWIDNGDWMDYTVTVTAGVYTFNFRVATPNSGETFQIRKADGTVIGTVNVPVTGGWDTWTTVSTSITLAGGTQTLRIYSTTSGWNFNWFEMVAQGGDGVGCVPPSIHRETLFSTQRRLWVVDKAKTSGGSKDLYFIDRNGDEYTGHDVDIRIIRSGHRNMASSPVGSIVSLKTPVKTVSGIDQIVIDSTINVVSAGAAMMKDIWSVENRLYKATICDSTNVTRDTLIHPANSGLVKRWIEAFGTHEHEIYNQTEFGSGLFVASRHVIPQKGKIWRQDRQTRGIVQFDLGFIPPQAIMDSVMLRLYAKTPSYLWSNVHYWSGVNKAQTVGINQSTLQRVIEPWNASTTFQQTDLITTTTNQVTVPASDSSCQDYQVNIKNMVKDMVTQPTTNYGILMKLSDPDQLDTLGAPDSGQLVNHMSFCVTSGYSSRGEVSLPPPACASCISIGLYMHYHYRKDSCYTDCRTIFDNAINPYVQGIWGDWRGFRSYVYYDRRKESDPLVPTNIRTGGIIQNFIPYWNMSSGGITPTTNDKVWVWNSESTMFNRRGLETENHDPLGRFNSGLYGYDNTMPVAVTQNARHRETVFEGFEDYGFATDSCTIDCPLPRHFDFSAYKDSITTLQKHTGKASLRLGASSSATVSAKVNAGVDTLTPTVNFNTGSTGTCDYFDNIKTSSNAVYPGFMPQPGKLMTVSAWVKEDKDCKCSTYTGDKIEFTFYHTGTELNTASVYPGGNIIEGWQRYDDTVRIPATADSMIVKLRNTTSVPVYFDDLRILPFNSNMKSFVYHPTTLRLLSELDENNYASFYEYDDQGTLIRLKKETERGIKTISETRSALQKTQQ